MKKYLGFVVVPTFFRYGWLLPFTIFVSSCTFDAHLSRSLISIPVHNGPSAGPLVEDAVLVNIPGNAVTGNLDIVYGPDGPAEEVAALQLLDRQGQSLDGQPVLGTDGSPLTSNGSALVYVSDNNGGVRAVVEGTGDLVFSVSLDPAVGAYALELASEELDMLTTTMSFSGPGGDQLNSSAAFELAPGLFVVATAFVVTDPPGTGYVQWDSQGLGVYNEVSVDKNIGPLEQLRLDFQDASGAAYPLKLFGLALEELGVIPSPPGLPQQVEAAKYSVYSNGIEVGITNVYGVPSGTPYSEFSSTTPFDSIVLTSVSKSSFFKARSITGNVATNLAYTVMVTDRDGDTATTKFRVTIE